MSSAAEPGWLLWLCGDHADRARFLAVYSRFSSLPIYGITMGATVLLSAFWYGWPLLLLDLLALLTMSVAIVAARHVERAELVAAVAFTLLQINLAVSVALSGGGFSPLLPLMAVPVFSQAVCFRHSIIRIGVVLSGTLAVLAVWLGGSAPTHSAPPWVHLVAYLTLLACLMTAVGQLVTAEMVSRDAAVLDPLTGLFNRRALTDRFRDAMAEAHVTGGQVSLVLCDIDQFKAVNDTHGHERGDRVLTDVAEQLRSCAPQADLVYRLGGEEFLVLLPGMGSESAGRLAERIRSSVGTDLIAGLQVTISAGVATAAGDVVQLQRLLADADAALYDAKRDGRNRVSMATGLPRQASRGHRRPISRGSAREGEPAPRPSATGSPGTPAG